MIELARYDERRTLLADSIGQHAVYARRGPDCADLRRWRVAGGRWPVAGGRRRWRRVAPPMTQPCGQMDHGTANQSRGGEIKGPCPDPVCTAHATHHRLAFAVRKRMIVFSQLAPFSEKRQPRNGGYCHPPFRKPPVLFPPRRDIRFSVLHHLAPAPSVWDASTRKNVTANDCGSFEGRSARNSVGYQWGTTQRKLVPVVSALRCCP